MSEPKVEVVDTKTGEVTVVETVSLVKTGGMRDIVKAQDIPLLDVMETMESLDWKNLKPHQTALLIMQKPFTARGGGQMFLSFRQAILFATRCYELGVSPFSSEVWFDADKASVNLTLEGKKQVARNKGIDLGPPTFEELVRYWKDVSRVTDAGKEAQKLGFTKDVGCKCRMRVVDPKLAEHVEYIAWLNEWFVPKSPVWVNKALHMLQTRATEKAISLVLGTGASSPVDDDGRE